MLFQLQDSSKENINNLMVFARQNELKLLVFDDNQTNYTLPGKPLNEVELFQLIETSRKSGSVSMEDALSTIRKNFHVD